MADLVVKVATELRVLTPFFLEVLDLAEAMAEPVDLVVSAALDQ
jgi:hypothetical protein